MFSRPLKDMEYYQAQGLWSDVCLGSRLRKWAERYGERTALVDQHGETSYTALDNQVDRLAAGLISLGLAEDDKVIVQLANSTHFFVVFFALIRIGAIPVLTLPAHRYAELNAICENASPKAYFISSPIDNFDYEALAEQMQAKYDCIKHVIKDGPSNDFRQLDSLMEPQACSCDRREIYSTALLLLSGGTTSAPKLIPRTHADYLFNFSHMANECQLNQGTVFLAALPVAHNFALGCPGVLGTLDKGGKAILTPTPDMVSIVSLIETHKVTHTALVPSLADLLASAAEMQVADLSSLQSIQVGGAPFSEASAKKLKESTGCHLQQIFGMAEGLLSFTRFDDSDEVSEKTQGHPLSRYDQIRIVDHTDNEVNQGEVGELLTKGPYTISGYYNADEHNQSAFTDDGFYRTGDLVCVTSQGNLIVKGRKKEQINISGEKFSPHEVESHLKRHPHVSSSAVVQFTTKHNEDKTCAFIVSTQEKGPDRHDLVAFLKAQGLAHFKLPNEFQFIQTLPLTAVGKIDRRALTKTLLEDA